MALLRAEMGESRVHDESTHGAGGGDVHEVNLVRVHLLRRVRVRERVEGAVDESIAVPAHPGHVHEIVPKENLRKLESLGLVRGGEHEMRGVVTFGPDVNLSEQIQKLGKSTLESAHHRKPRQHLLIVL